MSVYITKQSSRNEAIDMRSRRFGYFPRTFQWRGVEHHVEAIERCWTTGSCRNCGHMQRHYFQVRTSTGNIFKVYQDLTYNTWHIEVPDTMREMNTGGKQA